MSATSRLSALLAMVLVAGCKGPEARVSRSDTTPAVPAVIESPGALATRHEAQESLNRARAAFEQKQLETMRALGSMIPALRVAWPAHPATR